MKSLLILIWPMTFIAVMLIIVNQMFRQFTAAISGF